MAPATDAAAMKQGETLADVTLDESKMYTAEWVDGHTFGFTVTPVKSNRGTVLLLSRRTTARANLASAGLDEVVPGDMLISIGGEKVYHLGADNATKYLRSAKKPVTLTFQLSPYGDSSDSSLPDLAPNEYNYNWATGPLGLVLMPDPKSKLPVVKRISDKADTAALASSNLAVGDELVYVNEIPTSEYSMDAMMRIIKDLPKPMVLRFRKPLSEDQVEIPTLQQDEYDFLWEYGALGLVVGVSHEGLPFVRSFTGKGTSRQLALVQQNDEIVLVNDRSTKDMGFTETMNYIMNVPKPAVLRFRKRDDDMLLGMSRLSVSSNSPRSHSLERLSSTGGSNSRANSSNSLLSYPGHRSASAAQSQLEFMQPTVNNNNEDFFVIDERAFYQISWTDGPFGFTVREANSKRGTVMLVTKRTGKATCPGLRRVAVGDILIRIGDREISDIGFERATRYLRTVPKPVALTFQAID